MGVGETGTHRALSKIFPDVPLRPSVPAIIPAWIYSSGAITIYDVSSIVGIATARIGFTVIPGAIARVYNFIITGFPW